ncbi:O-methyltransferase [Peniophora sp. CONT]|nr:O-methyltransferase [Peniophora sp. CONT]
MTDTAASLDGLAELRSLAKLITESVDQVEAAMAAHGTTFPSTRGPTTLAAQAPRRLPEVVAASSIGCAAATQLVAALGGPMMWLAHSAMAVGVPAALATVTKGNVAEAVRENADGQGADVKVIAKECGIDADKLARVLRVLCAHYIFVEVSPDVFAHNVASALLDTGKRVADIRANPMAKHDGTHGLSAALEHLVSEPMTAHSFLADVLLSPSPSNKDETAFNRAFGTTLSVWDWYDLPENKLQLVRCTKAMEAGKTIIPPDAVLQGYDWAGLENGSVVVDVGGGVGTQGKKIVRAHPHLKIVVQDRAPVVEAAVEFWSDMPDAVSSGRVVLQANDFFARQPQKDARVFLLSAILHDWADEPAQGILKRLREAAAPHTELVIVDSLIRYLSPDDEAPDVPGAARTLPPSPLLPALSATQYLTDLRMLATLNGKERTVTQLRALLESAGWRLTRVYHGPTHVPGVQKAIAVPA